MPTATNVSPVIQLAALPAMFNVSIPTLRRWMRADDVSLVAVPGSKMLHTRPALGVRADELLRLAQSPSPRWNISSP